MRADLRSGTQPEVLLGRRIVLELLERGQHHAVITWGASSRAPYTAEVAEETGWCGEESYDWTEDHFN